MNVPPSGAIRLTKASHGPTRLAWYAFNVGKSLDCVIPETNALPEASTAMP